MKKLHFTAVIAAALMAVSLCSCLDKKNDTSDTNASAASEASTEGTTSAPPVPMSPVIENTEYKNGNYKSHSFSMYAEPNIWKYDSSETVTEGGAMPCDLKMVTDRDFTTCGLKIYVAENTDGKSAQEAISSENNDNIIFTGTTATAKCTFYYYEWAANDDLHCRSYLADFGGKYLCVYAESTNFGYVEGKITEILSSIREN
ncbi:hypothetical protein SAMN02910265_01357 [Ruminococcus flavefaciens]|uniref:DUF4367 domain-containing protein n=1 Tax=Ruminococcus flavefaciens TaxID=1265 RepID=A0A1H6J2Z0_RUMFL|nr:hypothetical protein [Ruminococcus flavefaciens]SEH54986.1 hypothetical protein SAMN02910265_01357 [Ruminococcus flavefaciens]